MAARAPIKKDLTAEQVRSLIDYDPLSGCANWKSRDDIPPHVNRRFAGKQIGASVKNYTRVRLYGKTYLLHRIIWLWVTDAWPEDEIDHVDGDKLNNKWVNLREATSSQNSGNTKRHKDNKSGLKGVSWHKKTQKYRATMNQKGRSAHIMYSYCPAAAHLAYIVAADKYFGEFARSM